MQNSEDSFEPGPRERRHECWLVMQSTYAEYGRASEALECADQTRDDLSSAERSQLAMLERQQRLAFERYLEARMAFLELRFDESNQPAAGLAVQPESRYSWIGSYFNRYRWAVEMLAIGLSCFTALCLVSERRQLRGLEAGRDEFRATLAKTRDKVELLAKTQAASVNQPVQIAAERDPIPKTRIQSIRHRSYYNFSLARSRQFQRVGPIVVSVRSVDIQRQSVSLSIISDSLKVNMDRIKLKQPVLINAGDRGEHLELVVDRISGNSLYGRLIQVRG